MRVETTSGEVIELGTTETGPTIGIIDYSRRVTDEFGVTTAVPRDFARRMSVRFALPFDQVDAVQRRLADLRATSARWVADDRFASLGFQGFYKDFDLDLAVGSISFCTLTVEGLAASEPLADTGTDPAPSGSVSTMRLLQPAPVAGGELVASSVPENDQPEWSSATTYALGAKVIKTATHRIYESAAAANVGNDPASPSGKWIDIGPTNRWAMFDQALGTVTSAANSVSVTLSAGQVDAVALLDVLGSTIRVQSPGYDRTKAVGAGTTTFLDLPATTGQVVVTVSGSGRVSVGTLLIGRRVSLGVTEASPTAGLTDFSRKEVDDFGAVTVVQRAWAKRMALRSSIRTDAVDVVANRIATVRATPALWIADESLDSLTIYGFFKEFSIAVSENVSVLSLTVEGLSKATPLVPLVPDTLSELDPEAAAALAALPRDIAALEAAVDGKVTTFFQAGTPTAEGVGDLWFDGAKWRRWSGTSWVLTEDGGIGVAIQAAAGAQATADGKIDSYNQQAQPTAPSEGDLWVQPSAIPKVLRRWNGSAWVEVSNLVTQGTDIGVANGATVGTTLGKNSYDADGTVLPPAALKNNQQKFSEILPGNGKPSPNAGTTVVLVGVRGTPVIEGNHVTVPRNGGTNVSRARVAEPIGGPSEIAFRRAAGGPNVGFVSTGTNIDEGGFDFHAATYNNQLRLFILGQQASPAFDLGQGSFVSLTYDRVKFRASIGGSVVWSADAPPNATYVARCDGGEGEADQVMDLRFLPYTDNLYEKDKAGPNAPANNATVGATVDGPSSNVRLGNGTLLSREELLNDDLAVAFETFGTGVLARQKIKLLKKISASVIAATNVALPDQLHNNQVRIESRKFTNPGATGDGTYVDNNDMGLSLGGQLTRLDAAGNPVNLGAVSATGLGVKALGFRDNVQVGSHIVDGAGNVMPVEDLANSSLLFAADVAGAGGRVRLALKRGNTSYAHLELPADVQNKDLVVAADGTIPRSGSPTRKVANDQIAIISRQLKGIGTGDGTFVDNNDLALSTDGFFTRKDANGNSVNLGGVSATGLGVKALGFKEKAAYGADLTGTPTKIADVNATEGAKLASVEQNATAGASWAKKARYWRITGTGFGRGYWVCFNIELRASVGSPDLTSGKNAVADSTESADANVAANAAIDDNPATYGWHSGPGPTHWWQVDLGAPQPVTHLTIKAADNNASFNDQPTAMTVSCSNDGANWTPVQTFNAIPLFAGGESRSFAWTSGNIEGKPASLVDLNGAEGAKLGGVEDAATRNGPERAINRNSGFGDGPVGVRPVGWVSGREGKIGNTLVKADAWSKTYGRVLEVSGPVETLLDSEYFALEAGEKVHVRYRYRTVANRTDGGAPFVVIGIEGIAAVGDVNAPSVGGSHPQNGPLGSASGDLVNQFAFTAPATAKAGRLVFYNSGGGSVGQFDYFEVHRDEPGATVGATGGAGGNLKKPGGGVYTVEEYENGSITVDVNGTMQNIGTAGIPVDNRKQVWGDVQQTPAELKDGRIPAALNSSGQVQSRVLDTAPFGSTGNETVARIKQRASRILTSGYAADDFADPQGRSFSRIVLASQARHGDVVSFPGGLPAVPKVTPLPGGNSGQAGQNVNIRAVGLTISGFNFVATSQGVTPGATITDSTRVSEAGGPSQKIDRSNSGAPFDGVFRYTVNFTVGSVPDPTEPGATYSGSVEVGCYAKKGGAWVEVGRLSAASSGSQTISLSPGSVDFGVGGEFGMTVLFAEGSGSTASFTSVSYALGSVTETSLTPAGASDIPFLVMLQ